MYPIVKSIEKFDDYFKLNEMQIKQMQDTVLLNTRYTFAEYVLVDCESQSYKINVGKNGITVNALDDIGFYYANITLKQISQEGKIVCCQIEDSPDIKNRAVMLDVSRTRIPTMVELKKMIDLFALLKYNQLQLYFEASFAYTSHEKVWKDISPFTGDEIIEIKKYCTNRAIELVPNQNSLGHLERWLKHPEYKHLAENPEGSKYPGSDFVMPANTICPTDDTAFKFICSLWDELLPFFDSNYANVGCDEPYDIGVGLSKEECDKRGKENVYLDFIKNIYSYIKSKNKTMMFWGDIIQEHPETIPELPKDVIAMLWGYDKGEPRESSLEAFQKSKIPFYVCLGTSTHLTISGRWQNTFANIVEGTDNAIKYNAIGAMITDWGDRGHHQQPIISIAGYVLGACKFWNSKSSVDIESALSNTYFHNNNDYAKVLMRVMNLAEKYNVSIYYGTLWGCIIQSIALLSFRKKAIANMKSTDFQSLSKELDDILLSIEKLESGTSDLALIKEEILFTVEWIKYFLDYCDSLVNSDTLNHDGVDENIKIKTQKDIDNIKSKYEKLWLKTSRVGGLAESLEYFDKFKNL